MPLRMLWLNLVIDDDAAITQRIAHCWRVHGALAWVVHVLPQVFILEAVVPLTSLQAYKHHTHNCLVYVM
jgi:hypothetical protein